MKYDLVDLSVFVNAVEAGSLTRGAERSNIVLAAASARMRILEERLGVQLLERGRSGVLPTVAGASFLKHARTLLDDARRLDSELAAFKGGVKGAVRVLSNTTALTGFLPERLGAFLALYPDISVTVEERLSHEIVHAISEDEADIGIVAATMSLESLESFPFAQDKLVLVVAGSSPLPSTPIQFADVLDQMFIGLDGRGAIQTFLSGLATNAGQPMKLRMQLSSFDSVCRMVNANAGIAVVPETAALRSSQTMDIRIIELADPWADRQLRLCVKQEKKLLSVAQLLLEHLKEKPVVG